MRIGGLRSFSIGDGTRTEAEVAWEETDRPPLVVFIEVSGPAADPVDPDAFLAAAAMPAFRRGERRIAIDGAVCPRLRDGIAAAASLIGVWNGHSAAPPVIEPTKGFRPPRPADRRRAAVMASGGIDSSHAILRNRRDLPRDHPLSFREALRVRDFILPADSSPERRAHVEARSRRAVSAIASAADLEITEIGTNAVALEEDSEGHLRWAHGSLLAAAAVAAGTRLTDVTISGSHDLATGLRPWGSHPLVDPNFGTAAVAIHHRGIETSRLGKTAELGAWPAAVASLYVCGQGPLSGSTLNCGSCEKCLRTRVSLLLGAGIAEPPTFPPGRLVPAEIEAIPPAEGFRLLAYYWTELAGAARAAGRGDLAGAIDRMIERQRKIEEWMAGRGWKGALRRFDRRHLGSALLRTRRRWISR